MNGATELPPETNGNGKDRTISNGGKDVDNIDCSGLTRAVFYSAYGVDIGEGTGAQRSISSSIGKTESYGKTFDSSDNPFKPGDLLHINGGHVAIYAGNGKMLHSSSRNRDVGDYGGVDYSPLTSSDVIVSYTRVHSVGGRSSSPDKEKERDSKDSEDKGGFFKKVFGKNTQASNEAGDEASNNAEKLNQEIADAQISLPSQEQAASSQKPYDVASSHDIDNSLGRFS